jgi:hypothetical protein
MEQAAGIQLAEGQEGRARHSRLLHVWTGSGLEFQVMADRALDISACRYQGQSLSWLSPAGEVHPAYYEPGSLGFLRSFPGGLLATCGLDQFGAPNEDQGEHFGIHGRVGHLPAQALNTRACWDGDEYLLEISGEMRQYRLFGENLLLRRRISTRLGSSTLRIADQVINEGYEPQPHMILYHLNFGFPLVSPVTRLELAARQTVARDADAQAGLGEWQRFQPPTHGYREQVFRHEPLQSEAGAVEVRIVNPTLDWHVELNYGARALPHLFQWKMMGQGAYVLGIEPANSGAIEGRAVARQRGDLPILAPGESSSYWLEIKIIPNDAVKIHQQEN